MQRPGAQARRTPIQEEMGAMEAMGAEVASTRKASFSREMRIWSISGRKVEPMMSALA